MDLKSLELVRVDLSEGVAEVTLSRPKALNAINEQMLRELSAAFKELASLDSLRCVILTGEGKAFVAGADISQMSSMKPEQAQEFSQLGHEIFASIEELPVPVLGAVNGFALGGGCELALACDVIYASDRAKFGQPEVKLGLIPGFGGCIRLPRKVGLAAAAEWIYTGDIYGAEQAKEIGLVREVVAGDQLMERVRGIAKTIASRAPLAVRAAKKVMVATLKPETDRVTIEPKAFGSLFATEDMREGTKAFVEKRDATFVGK